ncbi:MAG TPA: serine hydrolase domain-containing protein, partial [Gemmatimonadaceae bacterium]|nr:serine hydrolase domain-containing protein [Gemmatimonadaceae bacterium]
MSVRLLFVLSIMSIAASLPVAAQEPSAPRGTRPAPAITQAQLVERLTTSVDSLAKHGEFSGVVVLAKDGVPVYQTAQGFADRERRVANNLETAFNLGSINKIFTQISILQLAAAGKLDLDSTVAKYWPDYP